MAVRDPNVADNPAVSTSEGFESDNDAAGSTNTPQTSAVFTNVTIIGPYRGNPAAVVAPGFRRGARIRRNSGLKIFNSIFMDHATGLFIDGASTVTNATNGILKYRHNIVALAGPTFRVAEKKTTKTVFFNASYKNDSLSSTTGVLVRPYDFTNPDYRPADGSIALDNYDFTDESLPVTLTSFTGSSVKNDNILRWQTATEAGNKGFELQRSLNGRDYSAIAFVNTKAVNGNSNNAIDYSYVDANAANTTFYYRLKQVDANGRFSISRVVILTKSRNGTFVQASIYPNPVADNLNVKVTSSESKTVTLVVSDAYGRTIARKVVNVTPGENTFSINLKGAIQGNYFLNMISADGTKAKAEKFIKAN